MLRLCFDLVAFCYCLSCGLVQLIEQYQAGDDVASILARTLHLCFDLVAFCYCMSCGLVLLIEQYQVGVVDVASILARTTEGRSILLALNYVGN